MALKYPCVIIDHDDTAVDSTAKIHYPAHLEVIRRLRPDVVPLSLTEWFLKNFHPGIMEYLEGELGLTPKEMEIEYEVWKAHTAKYDPDFYPGFIETLRSFKRRGGIVAVVSHSETHVIERHYSRNGARAIPDVIFGWSYTKALRKPSPHPVAEILKKFDLDPSGALILDDLKPGVEMGRNAGVAAYGAGWGHDIPEIACYMKKHCAEYFSRVEDFASFLLG